MERTVVINLQINLNEDQPSPVKTPTVIEEPAMEGKQNPFGHIGLYHNRFLESAEDRKDMDGNIDLIHAAARDFFGKEFNLEIPEVKDLIFRAITVDPFELVNQTKGFTALSRTYLNHMLNCMYKPEFLSIHSVIKDLKKLEQKAIYDTSLTQEEEEVVYTTLSIAIHSLQYWEDVEERRNVQALKPFWKKFWKVVGVAAADVGAGALGSLVNPLVGGAAAGAASKAAS
ncbi:MAG: hypothetical protein AAFY70_00760 [Bacteroidota bacterium]